MTDLTNSLHSSFDGCSPLPYVFVHLISTDRLDDKTQARFIWSMEQLRVRNVQAGEPLVKHIDGKIWELRRASSGNIYRLMYFFFTGRRIVFLHGFQKKTQKIPRKEITIAQKRLERFLERGGE